MEEENIESVREALIKLSHENLINVTPAKIRKMKPPQLLEMYQDYKARELDELNEMFTDVLIIKLEDLMKYAQLISKDSHVAQKLQDKKLFRSDVKVFVSWITPILPFAGLLEGAVVIASEIIENFPNKDNESTNESESYSSS